MRSRRSRLRLPSHDARQMFRPAIRHPFVRTGPLEAGFRRNHKPGGIGIKRFGDEFFSHMRAVGIGRVDKIDSEFNGAAQNSNRFVVIFRRPPDSFSREAHGAEAEPVDYEIAADSELAWILAAGRDCQSIFAGAVTICIPSLIGCAFRFILM